MGDISIKVAQTDFNEFTVFVNQQCGDVEKRWEIHTEPCDGVNFSFNGQHIRIGVE